MKTIKLLERAGSFCENKDIARDLRLYQIAPMLDQGKGIILDFEGVDGATQSFIHALISDLIRNYGSDVLDRLLFKSCNETVQKIIQMVVDYMQEAEL